MIHCEYNGEHLHDSVYWQQIDKIEQHVNKKAISLAIPFCRLWRHHRIPANTLWPILCSLPHAEHAHMSDNTKFLCIFHSLMQGNAFIALCLSLDLPVGFGQHISFCLYLLSLWSLPSHHWQVMQDPLPKTPDQNQLNQMKLLEWVTFYNLRFLSAAPRIGSHIIALPPSCHLIL